MKLTIDQVMSYGPCYEQNKVEALFAGREAITLHDVAEMDIPDKDKVWLFCQKDVLNTDIEAKWREIIVTRAIETTLTVYNEPSYVKWAENWLNGTDRSSNSATAAANSARAAATHTATHAARAISGEYKQQVADLMELLDNED